MSDPIPTPRTDAAAVFCYGHIDRKWISMDFARAIERELAVAEEALEAISHEHRSMQPTRAAEKAIEARRHLTEMRAQKGTK